ncbi:fibronectin type III domain-containing protein [Flavivirga spongiicola]|uniref:Fibronectin type III domain-containing protein n=1 Tax=Flavivirga spongiicola TaxID=421621 RepID=A0ABU7XM02_9FLAO|nr:fibronectin type III domain-containing protein [Flavivirga sp. MEBiC05379]MDO5981444.1 fibronectin type III domain-containing protein [Flavivirga sp. MEBiC05379]
MKIIIKTIFLLICSISFAQFDMSYQAILDEATTQGYALPSTADQAIQNQVIVSTKANGIWASSDLILYFKGSGDKNFKLINWKNPTGPKATEDDFGGALTWGATGVKGDGLNLINTRFNPTSSGLNYLQNDAGVYVKVTQAYTTKHNIFGNAKVSINTIFSRPEINSDGSLPPVFTFPGTGLFGLSRNNATTYIVSVDSALTTLTHSSGSNTNEELKALGYGTVLTSNYTRFDGEVAYVIIGSDMSDKLSDMATAFETTSGDTQAPTASTLSSTSQTSTTVDLSWAGATDNAAVTGYKVYKDAVLETTLGNVSSYQVTGLTAATAYNFTVTALDAASNESVVSNTVVITTDSASNNIFLEGNAANLNNDADTIGSCTGVGVDITSVSNGDGTFKIRATANTTGTGRLVFYFPASTTGPHELRWTASESNGADGRTAQGKNSDGFGTFLTFTPKPSFSNTPTEYVSTLTNLDGTGFSVEFFMYGMTIGDYIDIDNISIIPIVDSEVPSTSTLSSTAQTDTTVDLSWTAATDNVAVTNYKVYKDAVLETTLGNVLTYQVTGLTAATAYNFTVTALDAAGNESVVSNTLAITTNPASGGGSGNWTLNNQDVYYNTGNVGIGTTTPDEKLAVNGNIHAKEIRVDLNDWPDYVFTKSYDLPTLKQVEEYIKRKGHLPNIPSAKEVEESGIQLGDMNAKLLEKIEELTLYILQQQRKIDKKDIVILDLEERLKTQESRLKKIENLLKL